MTTLRTILVLFGVLAAGLIGYQIGIGQEIATQIPAGVAPVAPYAYWYGPHMFGFGFLGFLFPLFFFFIFVALISAAVRGGRGWGGGYGHDWRRARLEEMHRELHGEKPQSGGTSSTST
jgi:hypothetical protein